MAEDPGAVGDPYTEEEIERMDTWLDVRTLWIACGPKPRDEGST